MKKSIKKIAPKAIQGIRTVKGGNGDPKYYLEVARVRK